MPLQQRTHAAAAAKTVLRFEDDAPTGVAPRQQPAPCEYDDAKEEPISVAHCSPPPPVEFVCCESELLPSGDATSRRSLARLLGARILKH